MFFKKETQILSGKIARSELAMNLKSRISILPHRLKLAIVQVGDRPDSTAFVKAKQNFAKEINVDEVTINLPKDVSEQSLIQQIEKLNSSDDIHGIIVQLPLPENISVDNVIESIDPKKDVDGLHSWNVKMWLEGSNKGLMPATARGIKELLNYYKVDLSGRNVVVIGRSMLVGKPIASMCLNQNATVTICHSKSVDLDKITRNADIIIVAVGNPNFVQKKSVSKNQIIIDVGITRNEEGTLVGDVDFGGVNGSVSAITPVPGGVGPMTVLGLFENLLQAYNIQKK